MFLGIILSRSIAVFIFLHTQKIGKCHISSNRHTCKSPLRSHEHRKLTEERRIKNKQLEIDRQVFTSSSLLSFPDCYYFTYRRCQNEIIWLPTIPEVLKQAIHMIMIMSIQQSSLCLFFLYYCYFISMCLCFAQKISINYCSPVPFNLVLTMIRKNFK